LSSSTEGDDAVTHEQAAMRREWDERAEEDPWHYVLLRDPTDWRGEGERTVRETLDRFGVRIEAGAAVEIGCGVGRLTWGLRRVTGGVIGIDVSPRMIELARANLAGVPGIELVVGDGASLRPVPDGSASLVFSALTLQHLPDAGLVLGYLAEAGRVLEPGGRLLVQMNNESSARFVARRMANLALRAVRRRSRLEHGRTWTGTRVSIAEVRRTLDATGIRVDAVAGERSLYCWVVGTRSEVAVGA